MTEWTEKENIDWDVLTQMDREKRILTGQKKRTY